MIKRIITIVVCLSLLTGCWSSEEIDNTALAHGVGLDKEEDKLKISLELIKPSVEKAQATDGTTSSEQNIILEKVQETMLIGARDLIRYSKRRIHFEHARVWIISEKLAKDDFVKELDPLRRDQMFRLMSYIFITKDDPSEILKTPTLYEDLTSLEIVSALEQTKYTTSYSVTTLLDFFKYFEGPLPNAYIPMISIKNVLGQNITSLEGTAIIKNGRMVGELNIIDTIGLNWMLNHIEGGAVSIELDTEDEKASFEILASKTKITPTLKGEQLHAEIDINVKGTLADITMKTSMSQHVLDDLEKKFNKEIESYIRKTLEKLQKKFKTDITGIGLETYRKYPKEWETVKSNWDEIFSNATVSINIQSNLTHPGLKEQNIITNKKRPKNNPYRFIK